MPIPWKAKEPESPEIEKAKEPNTQKAKEPKDQNPKRNPKKPKWNHPNAVVKSRKQKVGR